MLFILITDFLPNIMIAAPAISPKEADLPLSELKMAKAAIANGAITEYAIGVEKYQARYGRNTRKVQIRFDQDFNYERIVFEHS